MKVKSLFALGCLAMALAGTAQAADGDAEAGAQKAATCLGCHGVPGYRNAYPSYHVPKLGGQHPEYIVAALKEYKAGRRDHDTMQALAANLSEQDMKDLAAFFAQHQAQ